MNEYLIRIKDWWQPLSAREKNYIKIAAISIFCFLIFQLILMPYLNYVDDLREKLVSNAELLAYMQATDKKLKSLSNHNNEDSHSNRSPAQIITLLKQSIQHAGFAKQLTQLKQGNHEAVHLQLTEVEFDKFIHFLSSFSERETIAIKQLSVIPSQQLGLANIELELKHTSS